MNGPSETAAVEERVTSVVADLFGEDEARIQRSTRFVSDLDANPVEFVALLGALERELGVRVPAAELRERETVGATVDWIRAELGDSN